MNAVRGTIAAIDERGPTVLVTLAARAPAGGPETRLVAAVTRATLHGMRLAVGEEACFTFKAASVRLFER
jgi:molybdopterin-binding protein